MFGVHDLSLAGRNPARIGPVAYGEGARFLNSGNWKAFPRPVPEA